MAERSPGEFVEGWTNRPSVPPDLLPVWNSYAEWLATADWSPASADIWVERVMHHESAESRAMVFRVFLALVADRRKFDEETAPKPEEPSDG